MKKRLLRKDTLGELLEGIETIEDPSEGFYMLYAPRDVVTLTKDMLGAILLSFHDEDEDFVPAIAKKEGFAAVSDINTVQQVVKNAIKQNPNVSRDELIEALNYYLDNDAYIVIGLS